MKYILITVKKILSVDIDIITEKFETKEDAYEKMKSELHSRLKMDGDEDLMCLLEDDIEFSNVVLHKNDAYIYQDFGNTYYYWKILEI